MVAASEGHLSAVQILIELKADTATTDFTGRTAYDWAVRNKRRVVIRYLKSAGLGG
jgi:ankyrin repeat protein